MDGGRLSASLRPERHVHYTDETEARTKPWVVRKGCGHHNSTRFRTELEARFEIGRLVDGVGD